MQIVLTLRTYLVDDLQNPHIKIPIWQDTHIYETNTNLRSNSAPQSV